MPLYMGGSFVGSAAAATTVVSRPTINITLANGSVRGPVDTPAEFVGLAELVRTRGHGTKYATAEKRSDIKEKTDARMLDLKNQNFSDKEIAKILEKEHGVDYLPKSIASRLPKIQQRKRAEEDQKLDEECNDWHVGEDEKLYQAYGQVEGNINSAIAKLEAKRWNEVSRYLAGKMPERKYTGNACRERFEGLLDGTAELPIELDPDQERRRVLREGRITVVKRARAQVEEAAARAVQDLEDKEKQSSIAKMEYKKKLQEQAEARNTDKELDKQLRLAIANAKSQVAQKKRESERQEKEKREEKEKEQELENLVHYYYTGRVLQRRHVVIDTQKLVDKEDYLSDDEKEDGGLAVNNTPSTPVRRTENASAGPSTEVKISKQSLLNPRSIMTLQELELVLVKRNLPCRTAGETHPQLVARLAAADKDLKMSDLEDLLNLEFAGVKGSHKVKEGKLQAVDAKRSAAGQQGKKASDLEFKKQYEGYQGKGAVFLDGN